MSRKPYDRSLPLHFSRLMSAADQAITPGSPLRARLASEKAAEKSERASQDLFAAWLSRCGYEYLRPAMHRKSTLPLGWPDFTTASKRGLAICIEFKIPGAKLRPEQEARHIAMRMSGWYVATAYCTADAIRIMEEVER